MGDVHQMWSRLSRRQDGQDESEAILQFRKGGKYVETTMINYANNTSDCHRKLLFNDFLLCSWSPSVVSGCQCCDVCAHT